MKFRTLAVAAFVLATSSLFADTFVVDKAHSEATFQVRHMMSKVSGKFDDFSGKMNLDRAKPSALVGRVQHQGRVGRHRQRRPR